MYGPYCITRGVRPERRPAHVSASDVCKSSEMRFRRDNDMSGSQGLGLGLGNLSVLSSAETRSISPENFTGEKGRGGMSTEGTGRQAARDLGKGWKSRPAS